MNGSNFEFCNHDDLVEELVGLLEGYDRAENAFQTDVYLYLGDDGAGRLEEYTNIGGNSWRADGHYVLWRDLPHYPETSDEGREEFISERHGDYADAAECAVKTLEAVISRAGCGRKFTASFPSAFEG